MDTKSEDLKSFPDFASFTKFIEEEYKHTFFLRRWWWAVRRRFIDVKFFFCRLFQKITRGYSDAEIWNLGHYTAKFILKRIGVFIKHRSGSPCRIQNGEEVVIEDWDAILKKIQRAMQLIADDEIIATNEQAVEIAEGCKLLGEYFCDLWD